MTLADYRKNRTARQRRLDNDPATRMTESGDRGQPGAPRLALMQLECGHRIAIRPGDGLDEQDGWELAEKKIPNGAMCKKCNTQKRITRNCGSVLELLGDEEAEGGIVE